MSDYRVYLLNDQGRILRAVEISCLTDDEALGRAAELADGRAVELWEHARLVGRVARPERI